MTTKHKVNIKVPIEIIKGGECGYYAQISDVDSLNFFATGNGTTEKQALKNLIKKFKTGD